MKIDNGFIKIHRSITSWGWYKDTNTKVLFLHLILSANFAPAEFFGRRIEVGQLVTSLANLAAETGLSVMAVRTALKHLETTGEITRESTTKYTVISIKNYREYQSVTSQTTNQKQTSNKQATNEQQQYKKNKKNKKNKNIGAAHVSSFGDEPPPAIGRSGEWYIELEGKWHKFPEAWFKLAEDRGETIEQYVWGRHQ